MKVLVLDNYDSFTFNLVHYIEEIIGVVPDVYRNDELTLNEVNEYELIILSPGPGLPKDAGILKDVISRFSGRIPILGICLGLQAIVEVFGGKLTNLSAVYHGVSSKVVLKSENSKIFYDFPLEFQVGRYHSWVASKEDFPDELEVTCETLSGDIMGIRHKCFLLEAVQFHPESILTPMGKKMLSNFILSVKG